MGEPASFQGFENPERDVNATRWIDRLKALSDIRNLNKWAKYGPYSSNKTANKAQCSIFETFLNTPYFSDLLIESYISQYNEKFYLFIRIYNALPGTQEPVLPYTDR